MSERPTKVLLPGFSIAPETVGTKTKLPYVKRGHAVLPVSTRVQTTGQRPSWLPADVNVINEPEPDPRFKD